MADINEQKKEYNFLRTLAIGFGIAGIGIAVAIIGFLLSSR